MGKRYFHKNTEGNVIFTQIVKDNPSAEEIQSIIGTSEYKLIDTSVMDEIDPEFLGSVDTDFSKLDDNKLTVNLDKAKETKKENLRPQRTPLLEAQDILFLKAQEDDSSTSAIVKEKNRLRDITKTVDSCKTLDEVKAVTV